MGEDFLCPACQVRNWKKKNNIFQCKKCGTEVVPQRKNYQYTGGYQDQRGHYDDPIRQYKVQSFHTFLQAAQIQLNPQDTVLEVGFGGGAVLEDLAKTQNFVFGIEAHEVALAAMVERGFPREHLSTQLADLVRFKKPLDYLFYLDSFEHLLDPQQHLAELKLFVKTGSRAVVVTPRVDSLSRQFLGDYWPHNVPEHWVFYSHQGLIFLWEKNGWRVKHEWAPQKKVSAEMVLRHLGLGSLSTQLQPLTSSIHVWLSLGEMGVVFEKI